ncbi:MAG: rhomboid family intramembrane serine protease [Clostridia bacterium]|nr:rhomboid family intramembrane serine protease [Clostridia bacterium]
MDEFIRWISEKLIDKAEYMPPVYGGASGTIREGLDILIKKYPKQVGIIKFIDGESYFDRGRQSLNDWNLRGFDYPTLNPEESYFLITIFIFLKAPEEKWLDVIKNDFLNGDFCRKNEALLVLDLGKRNMIISSGFVYPFQEVCQLTKNALAEFDEKSCSDSDLEKIVSQKLKGPVSALTADSGFAPVSHAIAYGYGLIWLFMTVLGVWSQGAVGAGISVIGAVINIAAILIIGEVIEQNFGSEKYIFILIIGTGMGIFVGIGMEVFLIRKAFYMIISFSTSILSLCGALCYMRFRVRSMFSDNKFIYFSLLCFMVLTLAGSFLREGPWVVSNAAGFICGFLTAGILNFQNEILDLKLKSVIFKEFAAVLLFCILIGVFLH